MGLPDVVDAASIQKLNLVYPDLKVRVIRTYNDFFNRYQKKLRTTDGMRDYAEQARIYAQGRTAPGKIVTHAVPGSSFHNFGCAVDSCFVGTDPYLEALEKSDPKQYEFYWMEYGRFAKGNGLIHGGDWSQPKKDRPHVEITYGLSLHEVQALYAHGGIRAVWVKFDQLRKVEVGSEWGHILKL